MDASDRADRLDAGEIGGGEDGILMRVGNGDAADARMGERAAHEGDVLHAGKVEIGHELAAAAHQAVVFLAEKARADALLFHRDHSRRGNQPKILILG